MSVSELAKKTVSTLREEGVGRLLEKTKNYVGASLGGHGQKSKDKAFMDVLFINGCDKSVPHPPRYRVTHQREQLLAFGIESNEVFYTELQMDQVRHYRSFVFFRCPYTDMIGAFIEKAKQLNKKVFFDIDDLVVDTKYTDTIKYLATMNEQERALYDDGVRRMGRTLQLCDAAIVTTERLAEELSQYVPEVFINRNTASESMLILSEDAAYERDVLPYLEADKVPKKKKKLQKRAIERAAERKKHGVSLAYFSGSLTHNDDFILIQPALIRLMEKYPTLELHVVGELDVPKEMEPYRSRIVARPFVDWKKLPQLIASIDINLAPLEQSIFNEAKSENKWVEAALVKVPTVASEVGAFARMIEDGQTGFLCRNEEQWVETLSRLIEDQALRQRIGRQAYEYCKKRCVTMYTGRGLAEFLQSRRTENIAFVLPSLQISGGIMVALRHATMLQDAGYDVMLVDNGTTEGWCQYEGHEFPVVQARNVRFGRLDKAVATMWVTEAVLEAYPNIRDRYYLVQNFETDFYEPKVPLRIGANMTYRPHVPMQFVTISKWCQNWLAEDYGQQARYARNGIDTKQFAPKKRDFSQGKIRILIEGDCGVYYKNVDESFRIVDKLDPDKYEIWYMSYNAKPKAHYRVDKFLHQIPYEKVAEVYHQCHILIKSSFLESFSYPPLEMMATGGYSVVVPNGGNQEYLRDGENCLLYPCGDVDAAVAAIERIVSDEALRDKLYEGGVAPAQSRSWPNLKAEIGKLYDLELS